MKDIALIFKICGFHHKPSLKLHNLNHYLKGLWNLLDLISEMVFYVQVKLLLNYKGLSFHKMNYSLLQEAKSVHKYYIAFNIFFLTLYVFIHLEILFC